jgi:hypothetical protein
MNSPGHRRRQRTACRLLMGLLVAGACFAVSPPPAFSADGDASGLMIYVDPQTGAILKVPAPGTVPLQLSPELQNALSTSHDGLVEVPSPLPGGGIKLDLQGRFQSPLFVTIDANGNAKILHLHETPEPGDKK